MQYINNNEIEKSINPVEYFIQPMVETVGRIYHPLLSGMMHLLIFQLLMNYIFGELQVTGKFMQPLMVEKLGKIFL